MQAACESADGLMDHDVIETGRSARTPEALGNKKGRLGFSLPHVGLPRSREK